MIDRVMIQGPLQICEAYPICSTTVAQVNDCLVAGTLVHTQGGPVPIEKIRVGDLVLSQPEMKGELVYRKVVNTFVHEDKELTLVDYLVLGKSVGEIDPVTFWDDKNESDLSYLVTTGTHSSVLGQKCRLDWC